jgi:NAD(P)-dependent dehydrogenase (short-subunit alcohol dehydrogenase family)
MDVTAPGAPARIVAEAVSRFGGLDILVNNAAVFYWKKLFELTADDWNLAVATNLTAPFFLTQEAAKVMIDQGRGGAIINITSIHGSVADANVAAQCATKFGLTGLTAATAEALREFEIRVNAVAPGSIEPNSADRRGSSLKSKVTQADVATLVAFLASDLARSVTGATIEALGSTRTVIKA